MVGSESHLKQFKAPVQRGENGGSRVTFCSQTLISVPTVLAFVLKKKKKWISYLKRKEKETYRFRSTILMSGFAWKTERSAYLGQYSPRTAIGGSWGAAAPFRLDTRAPWESNPTSPCLACFIHLYYQVLLQSLGCNKSQPASVAISRPLVVWHLPRCCHFAFWIFSSEGPWFRRASVSSHEWPRSTGVPW